MSLGKNKSNSQAATVWEGQSPFLQQLYTDANSLYNTTQSQQDVGTLGTGYANNIAGGAMTGFNQALGGGQSGQFAQNPFLQAMASGQMQNQALGGAIGAGLGQIGQNFQNNIMPGINTGSAMTNTSGGSRQGIAQGLAAGQAGQQGADFIQQMLSGNFQNQMQNQLGALGQMGTAAGQADQYRNQAMGLAPQLANLGFAGQSGYYDLQNQMVNNQFNPITQYANILGGPTVLGGSSSSSGFNIGAPQRTG